MKVVVIGAGRMGLRHASGVLAVDEVDQLFLIDIAPEALERAKGQLSRHKHFTKISFLVLDTFSQFDADVVIIASTAANREKTCALALSFNPRYIMIEKPLGQSLQEVSGLISFFDSTDCQVCVNLNMRLYPFVQQLKTDLHTWPQLEGPKTILFNGGSLGIGANGIHYLDLVYYLLNADKARLIAGQIDADLIPSGRGTDFGDFGGWAAIEFSTKEGGYLGKAILNMSAVSTVFGGWDIVAKHGRIRLNELEGKRVDIIRSPDSQMPVNRYAADYLPPRETPIESPELKDLTTIWLQGLIEGKQVLPDLKNTFEVHQTLFSWLELSDTHSEKFPIT